jgi:hypothetical protein
VLYIASFIRRYPTLFSASPFGTRFANAASTAGHRQDGAKPHGCSQCDRAFARKADLKRHMNQVHLKHRLQCEMCEASYQRKDQFRDHRMFTNLCAADNFVDHDVSANRSRRTSFRLPMRDVRGSLSAHRPARKPLYVHTSLYGSTSVDYDISVDRSPRALYCPPSATHGLLHPLSFTVTHPITRIRAP